MFGAAPSFAGPPNNDDSDAARNTAGGSGALFNNSTGVDNTAFGFLALANNTAGSSNTAYGKSALRFNTGSLNTAVGVAALGLNGESVENTAVGFNALLNNTTGCCNTAVGLDALFHNSTGKLNTAYGIGALFLNTAGFKNTAYGSEALLQTTGNGNIALGFEAGQNLTTGSNNIDIGDGGVAGESNTIRIGTVGTQEAIFVAGIRGSVVPGGVGVVAGTDGRIGTVLSSARLTEAIKPMDQASEALLALKPVTFRYKHELDPDGIPQFGLVAEQVEEVNPDLVARDGQGKVNTVRYEAVNAMLLNEFLKEHRKVQELEAAIVRQQNDFAQQQKEIEVLAASLKQQAMQVRNLSQPPQAE
jgi:hypothetical protein